jgi:hypothetical protein
MPTQLLVPGRQTAIANAIATAASGTIGGCPGMPHAALHAPMNDEPSAGQPVVRHGIKEEHLEEQGGRGTYSKAPES